MKRNETTEKARNTINDGDKLMQERELQWNKKPCVKEWVIEWVYRLLLIALKGVIYAWMAHWIDDWNDWMNEPMKNYIEGMNSSNKMKGRA